MKNLKINKQKEKTNIMMYKFNRQDTNLEYLNKQAIGLVHGIMAICCYINSSICNYILFIFIIYFEYY